MFAGGMDAYRTNFSKVFIKFQYGFEGNYFLANRFALGLGLEVYRPANATFISFGPRLYPFGKFFLRFKPLFPLQRKLLDNIEAQVGMGYDIFIGDSDTWAIELAADYYLRHQTADLRIGLATFF